jgi:cytochrome P450
VSDIWGAGLETTATTLRWAFLFLLHNPEVQERVQKELDKVVGKNRNVEMADRPNLPYTNATILEVQRRANILPINIPHKVRKGN